MNIFRSTFRSFTALAIVLTAAGAAIAQQPQPSPSTQYVAPTVTDHKTPGGIAFRHMAMPDDSHHALTFGWRDGRTASVPGKEGLSVLAPQLMLEGTAALPRSQQHEALSDLRTVVNLRSSTNFTRGSINAPTDKFSEAVTIAGNMLSNPALPADKLKLLQGNLTASLANRSENSEQLADRAFLRVTLGDGPAYAALRPNAAAINAITVADIQAWHRAVLARDTVMIGSAGPLPVDKIAAEIDKLFAGLPAAASPAAIGIDPKPRQSGRLIVIERPTVQTMIIAGGPSGWTTSPDLTRGLIAVRGLSGGFGSRLYAELREKLGAAYNIKTALTAIDDHQQLFTIRALVAHDKAAAALAAIRTEYARFLDKGLTVDEVEPVKAKRITEVRESIRRSLGAARLLRDNQLAKFPADHRATFEARLAAITVDAVNDGIRTKFPKAPLTILMIAPSGAGLGADCVVPSLDEIAKCD